MNQATKKYAAVAAAGVWVNASEFFRNEVLLRSYWTEYYNSLGLTFPSAPVNGMMWIVWGFSFAGLVFLIAERNTQLKSVLISWFAGFVLMWIVTWNLGVLPLPLLQWAIPLSLLEAFIAVVIIKKISPAP